MNEQTNQRADWHLYFLHQKWVKERLTWISLIRKMTDRRQNESHHLRLHTKYQVATTDVHCSCWKTVIITDSVKCLSLLFKQVWKWIPPYRIPNIKWLRLVVSEKTVMNFFFGSKCIWDKIQLHMWIKPQLKDDFVVVLPRYLSSEFFLSQH